MHNEIKNDIKEDISRVIMSTTNVALDDISLYSSALMITAFCIWSICLRNDVGPLFFLRVLHVINQTMCLFYEFRFLDPSSKSS